MAETKHYEVNGFSAEFTPQGDPYKGILVIRAPELEPFTAEVNLSKPRSCNEYASRAHEVCGMSKSALKVALNALCSRRYEEVAAAQEAEREETDGAEEHPEVDQEEIDDLVGRPGVLGRLVGSVATYSRVVKEWNMLKLITLQALSAQLELLPTGKPIGSNVIVTAEAGRGKNFVADAVARVLPPEFYFAFESSSAMALYYRASDDPAFLKFRWIYPNEAEGADLLVEMFRPLLSGGSARHITVNKDAAGRNVGAEFVIEGPVTLAIPTVRNKLDSQLQTRMLVAGLEDYAGRVADHSREVSRLISSGYAATDYSGEILAWQAALRSLTGIRRVVIPVEHEGFCFDSDDVSHGARLWTNVLGLMCAHAWLEQRNREVRELPIGEAAVVACPEDYEVAYEVFRETCERSVLNLSEAHRKILDAAYELQKKLETADEWDGWAGLAQRKIAQKADVSQSTVSANKAFLVKSAKFLREIREGGLALVEGAEPSWWAVGDALDGFPRPEEVRTWWSGDSSPPDPEGTDHADHAVDDAETPHDEGAEEDRYHTDHSRTVTDQPWADGHCRHGDREDYGDDRQAADQQCGLFEGDASPDREVIGTIDGVRDEDSILSEMPLEGEGDNYSVNASDVLGRQAELDLSLELLEMSAKDALEEVGWTCTVNFAEVKRANSSEPSFKDEVDVTRDQVTQEIRTRLYRYHNYAKSAAEVFGWKFDVGEERKELLEEWPATPEEMHEHLQVIAPVIQGERPFYDQSIVGDDRSIRVQYWEKARTGQGVWVFAVFGADGPSDYLMEKIAWEKVQEVEDLVLGDPDW